MPPTLLAAVSLCLACSASLPPHNVDAKVYYTRCCSRPICPHCLSTNPRLARYNPCLRCLAGVNAVKTRLAVDSAVQDNAATRLNVDGSVRDEDIFVVEDEDDSESDKGSPNNEGQGSPGADALSMDVKIAPYEEKRVPPACNPSDRGVARIASYRYPEEAPGLHPDVQGHHNSSGTPPKYYIRPDDTLLGISLKLRIDGRILCRLNNLPASTLRTTPHLLHTRSFLTLPPSALTPPPLSPVELAADEERKARLSRERAETRFQAMTKETDRGVAKAYVALAGLSDGETSEIKEYEKENGLRKRRVRTSENDGTGGQLEGRAMDRYFDDEEWEAEERAEGRKVALPRFPYASTGELSRSAGKVSLQAEKSWWRWKN